MILFFIASIKFITIFCGFCGLLILVVTQYKM